MKKTISKLIIFLLLIQTCYPFFFTEKTHADNKNCENNPPVCTATPNSMNTYIEFQNEVINLLDTNKFKTATETMSEGEAGLFTSKILQLTGLDSFGDSLIGQSLKIFDITISRSAISILTTVFLFELSAIGTLGDNTIELSILFQDRPIVRDRSKLLDIERKLNQVAYNLGHTGEIGKTVTELDKINAIIEKYKEKGLFTGKNNFGDSQAYTDIIIELASLNSAVKRFLAYNSTSPLKNFKDNGHFIEINSAQSGWIDQLNKDYQCSRSAFGFKCNTSWNALKQNLKILGNSTKKQGQGSINRIKESASALMQSLSHRRALGNNLAGKANSDKLTTREKQLLQGRYGLNTKRITNEDKLSILSLNSNLKGQRNKAAKSVSSAASSVAKTTQAIFSTRKGLNEKIEEALSGGNKSKVKRLQEILDIHDSIYYPKFTVTLSDYTGTNLSQNLINAYTKLEDSKREAQEIAVFSNNIDLTKDFNELYLQLDALRETIGDKNNQQSLRHTLKSVCEAQCKDKNNGCCYVE